MILLASSPKARFPDTPAALNSLPISAIDFPLIANYLLKLFKSKLPVRVL